MKCQGEIFDQLACTRLEPIAIRHRGFKSIDELIVTRIHPARGAQFGQNSLGEFSLALEWAQDV